MMLLTGLALAQSINIDPPTRSLTKDGGGGSILTSGSGTWTAEKNVSWITITPRTSGTAGQSCIYVVNSNFSADTRQGIITLAGKTHTVTQTGYNATLSPTSGTTNLNGSTGSVSVTVDAGVAWSAVSNAEWVTVSPASGTSSGTVTYTVAPYAGVTNRTTSLTIAGKTFALTQTGTDVNISPKSVEKAYSSDIIQVSVSALATTTWNVTPNASWISVVDPGNKFGDSTITLAVSTNPSYLDRTGTVTIGSATFTIRQSGTPNPVLDILPKEATADPSGAYGNVAVLATPDSPWSAESLSPWIVISQGTSGAGNGNIQYVASANPNLTSRSGKIKITPASYQPKIDLTWQLQAHVYNGSADASGWGRNLSGSLTQIFNGTSPLTLGGQDFYRSNDAFSVAFWFSLNEIDAVNRLFEADRSTDSWSTLYVDASNKLVFKSGAESLTSSFSVTAGKTYQVVLTVDSSKKATLYTGERGVSISEVGSRIFTQPPFPADYVKPTRVRLGMGNQPSAGNLSNASINDLRIHTRALSALEAASIFALSGSTTPYGDTSDEGDPTTSSEYNLRGQSIATGGNRRVHIPLGSNAIIDSRGLSVGNFSLTFSYPGFAKSLKGVASSGWDAGSSSPFSYSYTFNYADGSQHQTNSRSVSGYATTTNIESNPFPFKALNSITLWYNVSRQFAGLETSVEGAPFVGWSFTADKFGVADRALAGKENSRFVLLDHQNAFSQYSATYNFWLKYDTTSIQSQRVLTRGDFDLTLTGAGSSLLLQRGSSQVSFTSGMQPNEWHMLTISATYGGVLRFYVDGQEIGNTPIFGNYCFGKATSATALALGGWNGAIDYAGFYDQALSSAQVRAVYNAQKPQFVYHTVTQSVVSASISPQIATLPAAGGTTSTALSIAQNVNWTASTSTPWLTITSPGSGAGSTTVEVLASANPTVYERTGTVTAGDKTFTITQAGLNANVTYEETVFSTDGGSGWVEVSPEGNAQWQSVSDVAWLTVALGESGVGAGSVFIVADPYTNTSQSRTGSVTIAGKKVYFTQRGYTLSITPQVAQVGSNAGAGEFGVAAPISAVWEAIVTQPWISLVGGSTGLGNGTVRYSLASNTTGQSRTGRIIVSGKEYTITQLASLLVTTQASSGGTVSGGGSFDVNATATLTATPSTGFAFSHWTGDAVGSANPLQVAVDSNKSVQANFVPTSATTGFFNNGVQSVVATPNTYGLYKSDQMRSMAMGVPVLEVNQATGKGKIQFGIKQSQDLNNWSDMNINSADVYIRNGKLEIEFTRTGNAAFYQVIGSETSQ
jgi:hypothetical protein